jgi:amidohydrolase
MVTINPSLKSEVDRHITAVLPDVVAFRHERHKHPELTWNEHATAKAVAAALKKIDGITLTEGVGRLGVVGMIEGSAPGPTVALRADMDALPITETTGKPYQSCTKGVMHACGHDGHMANLYGAARVLSAMRGQLKGRVKLIFQPAEEGGAGADVMCDDGVLENPKVDVIFGLHGWPEAPVGQVFLKGGPLLASTTELEIVVSGVGCHAALPHLGTDQILAASRIVEALQSVSSRLMSPTEPIALSITQFHGGTATNVIPPHVTLGGTLRTMSIATRDKCSAAIERIVQGVGAANGVTATVKIQHNYPPTVNDVAATDYLEQIAAEVLPAGAAQRLAAPTMGGEDFSYFLQRVKGSYFFLGMNDGRAGGYPSLHHPAYDFNDAALPTGMRMFVHAALAYATHSS